jgi:hypothetical protein
MEAKENLGRAGAFVLTLGVSLIAGVEWLASGSKHVAMKM